MNGAWIVTYRDTNTERINRVVCSSLSVVVQLFPSLATVNKQSLYRNHGHTTYQTEPDELGRCQVEISRVPMYRPGDVT